MIKKTKRSFIVIIFVVACSVSFVHSMADPAGYYAQKIMPIICILLCDDTDDANQNGLLISQYQPIITPFQLTEIPEDASGITWHENIEQFLVVQNNGAIIYRYDESFTYINNNITKVGSIDDDIEGLAFVANNEVMMVTEQNFAHKAVIDQTTSVINGDYDQTPAYRLLPSPISNKGIEGVAVSPASINQPARVYACTEGTIKNNTALMQVVYFDLPSPDPISLLSFDSTLDVIEPFSAELKFQGVITDCAGMVYDIRTDHLIILSEESAKAIQVDPQTGDVLSQLSLPSQSFQWEGVTIGKDGKLIFVGEPNWIHRYQLP